MLYFQKYPYNNNNNNDIYFGISISYKLALRPKIQNSKIEDKIKSIV